MSSADQLSVFPACDPDDNLSAICRELCAGLNDVLDNDYFLKKKLLLDDPLSRPEIAVNINADWTVTQDQTNSCDRFDSGAYVDSEEEDQVEYDDEDESRVYSVRDNPAFFTKFDESSCDSVDEQVVPSGFEEASPVDKLDSSPASPKSDNEDVSEWEKKEDTEKEEEVDRSKRKERDGESESEDVGDDVKNKDDELMRNSTAKRVHLESETENLP